LLRAAPPSLQTGKVAKSGQCHDLVAAEIVEPGRVERAAVMLLGHGEVAGAQACAAGGALGEYACRRVGTDDVAQSHGQLMERNGVLPVVVFFGSDCKCDDVIDRACSLI